MDTDKKEKTDLAKSEPGKLQVAASDPIAMAVELCKDGKMDVDTLTKLLELREREDKRQAKKDYIVAMAAFKADPPQIIKDKNVSYPTKTGTTDFNHATLGNVTATLNQALSVHGLTAGWATSQTEKGEVKVTCTITHIQGHSESCSLHSAADGSGGKNAIQAIGSAVTYLERYTLLALCGLATYEQDDDGNGAGNGAKGPPAPTPEEQEALDALCFAMEQEVPDGLTIDPERIKIVCYAQQGRYPYDVGNTSKVAAWLAGILNLGKSWQSVCKKP